MNARETGADRAPGAEMISTARIDPACADAALPSAEDPCAARVAERLSAYIHPNRVETEDQRAAFEAAVEAQLGYERQGDLSGVPGGAEAFSIGNYSVTLREAAGAALTRFNICPVAWATLYNAGLLRRCWPVAKRL